MLRWAVEECSGPVAIRYPRGGEGSYSGSDWSGSDGSLVKCHRQGKDVTLITYGSMLDNVLEAAQMLAEQGVEATVLRLLTVSDLPAKELVSNLPENHRVIVAEEVCRGSGIREALAWELQKEVPDCQVFGMDLGRDFVPHGSQKELYRHCGLDARSIAAYTKEVLSK